MIRSWTGHPARPPSACRSGGGDAATRARWGSLDRLPALTGSPPSNLLFAGRALIFIFEPAIGCFFGDQPMVIDPVNVLHSDLIRSIRSCYPWSRESTRNRHPIGARARLGDEAAP